MMENLLSQRLPASQRILNCGDSLNRLGERIISPFHQIVKIWSSHLDIWPVDRQIFVRVRIIGYNPRSFAISVMISSFSALRRKMI
jgi:hypothetical protein